MTSGKKTRRPEACRLALAALLLAAAGAAHAFDLPALAAMLATHSSGQARFTEQRWAKGLDQPLASSGTLSFAAPDRFTRRTLEPRAETMAVEGNTLTMSRGGRTRTLALDAVPEAAVAVEAIRGTLTGDAAALQRDFEVSVGGDAEHWTLALVPREAGGPLAGVRIAGHRDVVQTVETRLADGGRSVMTITALPAGAETAASGTQS
jgi:outer membrane lipoprotein-sorting protein